VVLVLDRVAAGLKDASELFEMAREENDDDTLAAVQADIATTTRPIPTTASSTSRPAPAAPKPATGPRCCCGNT
jgi:peptide chain release factor 2